MSGTDEHRDDDSREWFFDRLGDDEPTREAPGRGPSADSAFPDADHHEASFSFDDLYRDRPERVAPQPPADSPAAQPVRGGEADAASDWAVPHVGGDTTEQPAPGVEPAAEALGPPPAAPSVTRQRRPDPLRQVVIPLLVVALIVVIALAVWQRRLPPGASAVATPSAGPTSVPTSAMTPSSSLSGQGPNDAANRAGWKWTIDGVGPLKPGMTVAQAESAQLITRDGATCGSHRATPATGDTIAAVVAGDLVDSVTVRSSVFSSPRGVHVGWTEAQLRQLYGKELLTLNATRAGAAATMPGFATNDRYLAFVLADGEVGEVVIGRKHNGAIELPTC